MLQRERFLAYLPAHSNGVAFIMLVSSINAVCYNMVGAGQWWVLGSGGFLGSGVYERRWACCVALPCATTWWVLSSGVQLRGVLARCSALLEAMVFGASERMSGGVFSWRVACPGLVLP